MKVSRSEVGTMKSGDTIDEFKRTEAEVTEETTKKHGDAIDRTTATDDSLEGTTATADRQGTGKADALKGLKKSIKLKQKSMNQTEKAQDRVLDSAEDDSSGSSSSEIEQRFTHEDERLNEENEEENRKKEGNLEEDSKIESRSLQSGTDSQISKCSRIEMNSNDSDEAHSCIGSMTDGDSVSGRISAGLNIITKNQKVRGKAGTNQINRSKKADNEAGELDFANALKELKALREKEEPNSGEQSAMLQRMGFVSNKEPEEKKGKERKPGMAAIEKVNLPMLRNMDEKDKKVEEKVQENVNPSDECPKSETIVNPEKSERFSPFIP